MSERLVGEWNKFVMTGEITSEKIHPAIRRSWERCRDKNIDPILPGAAEILSPSNLARKIEHTSELIDIATPIMKNLFYVLKGLGFVVLLSDSQGYILKCMVDEGFKEQAGRVMMCEGANWGEEVKGTNAIGTSLAERNPISVFAYEHYLRDHHILACTAVPIFTPAGELMGTLDVTGEFKRNNNRIARMAMMAAHSIEREIKLLNLKNSLNIHKNKYENLLERMNEGTIVLEETGVIKDISTEGARHFGLHRESCLGVNINDLLNFKNLWSMGLKEKDKPITSMLTKKNQMLAGDVSIIKNETLFSFHHIIGNSPQMTKVIATCRRVAFSHSTVLINGETGTGKELLAQAIHKESNRRLKPFIAVNCGSIPANLVETELFGYEEGSFTGAKKGGNPGKFELADGGTIFLDEIGDMPLHIQVSLLRVLQEKKIFRIGGRNQKQIDVRVIAATNRDLAEMVHRGEFREDLFYRLNVVTINVPPLRQRKEDLELLTNYFVDKYKDILDRKTLTIDRDVLEIFSRYTWPGNVRELEHVIEGLINTVEEEIITQGILPEYIKTRVSSAIKKSQALTLRDIERKAIYQAISECGNLVDAALRLNIGRSTLYRKIKEYNIEVRKILN